jgi:outer membrane immunogenic protein
MIRSGLAVAVAISATLGLGGASAADLSARAYTKVPISQAPPISWTGCYMGGNVGAGWDRFNAGEVAFAGVPTPWKQ